MVEKLEKVHKYSLISHLYSTRSYIRMNLEAKMETVTPCTCESGMRLIH